MKPKRRLRALAATLAALAAILLTSSSPGAATGAANEEQAESAAETTSAAGAILTPAERLEAQLARVIPASMFAGIEVDPATLRPTVHVVKPRTKSEQLQVAAARSHLQARSRLSSDASPAPDLSTTADFSLDELEEYRAYLEGAYEDLERNHGIFVAGFWVDVKLNRVVVHIGSESTTASVDEVAQVFDPRASVEWGTDVLAESTSRLDNTAPYTGASTYESEFLGGTCTSGLVWWKNSSNYDNFVSAAHCTGPQLRWKNVTTGAWVAKTYDSSLLHSNLGDWSYADWYGGGTNGHAGIWRTNSDFRLAQSYYTGFHGGVSVCLSGATSQEKCGFVVNQTNICIRMSFPGMPPNVMFCGMNTAFKSGSAPASVVGDSGGAVYHVRSNGRATAAGIVSGVYLPNPSAFIYTPVVTIRVHLGGSPATCSSTGDC